MKWLVAVFLSLLFSNITSSSYHNDSLSGYIDAATFKMMTSGSGVPLKSEKSLSYSTWGIWTPCINGHRTRRKHCIRRLVCGDSLRVEIQKCHGIKRGQRFEVLGAREQDEPLVSKRQLNSDEILKRFIGFTPWTNWTNCSRKCLTVRKRYCRRPQLCGKKVIRQSAYCYLEGSYCQRWIRGRMQRRKDPDSNTVPESLPSPELAFHDDDSLQSPRQPACGILGKYRGSPAYRMRLKMREMLRIIGGKPTIPGKWPWQVAVLNRFKEAFCGGTLVSLRWVVTAAHCVRRRLYVRLGEYDLMLRDPSEVEMRITEAVIHPKYDPDTVVNDVAMLRLPEPARPRIGHSIACLPQAKVPLPPHASCVILGWGKRRASDVHGTRVLHEAQVSTIQQGVCRRTYWQYAITDDMVCAGRGRRDSCAGDSGGPLLCRHQARYYLQGITSFGDGCGKRGKYGIYTRTAGYVPWINSVIKNKYFDD